MMRKFIYIFFLFVIIFVVLNWLGSQKPNLADTALTNIDKQGADYGTSKPIPKGDRLLAIDINETAKIKFDEALTVAKSVGVDFNTFSVSWDFIETAPGIYNPSPNLLEIANIYYPAKNVPLLLTIAPLDTNVNRLPSDLKNKPFDDPEVISRFNKLLDYVFNQLKDAKIIALSIGNEVDLSLLTPDQWQEYRNFFDQTSQHAKELKPDLPVGVKATANAVFKNNPHLKELNELTDVAMITYYPGSEVLNNYNPDVVIDDFEKITKFFPQKNIFLVETGFPSSQKVGSSQQKQEKFINNTFAAWDKYQEQIKLISFHRLYDWSKSEVDYFASYYGVRDKNFSEFLGTLGLKTTDGRDKEAFTALKNQAKQRGW